MKPAAVSVPSDTEVLVKRDFDAPVDLVWQAYTVPDLMRRWLQGPPGWTMPVCEMDVQFGGKYLWRWRDTGSGQEFGFSGKFLEVAKHSRLAHTQLFHAGDLKESMGNDPYVVTVVFEEANGVTSVATTIKFASKEDRDAAMSTGMTDGMEMNYQKLDSILAS